MAFVPMIIMGIGAAISAVSTISQASQQAALSRQSASYARQMGERNRMLAEYSAQQTRSAGEENASLIRERQRQMLSRQRAAYGASGVDLSGSPLEFMGQTAGEYERDAHNTILNANYQAWRIMESGETSLIQSNAEASRYNAEADIYASRGMMAGIAAPFAVGSSILTGYRQFNTGGASTDTNYRGTGNSVGYVPGMGYGR